MSRLALTATLLAALLVAACVATPTETPGTGASATPPPESTKSLPTPTRIAGPPAQATPTALPPPATPGGLALPGLSYNLLFLEDGRLIRWDSATGSRYLLAGLAATGRAPGLAGPGLAGPGLLPGSVVAYAVQNPAASVAVIARLQDRGTFDIATVGIYGGEPVALTSVAATDLPWLAVSPDGRWAAYIASGPARDQMDKGSGTIYALPLDPPGDPIVVGECLAVRSDEFSFGCRGTLWSPDSRSLLWGDGHGVWLAGLDGGAPQQILTAGPAAPGDTTGAAHAPLAWSPNGRFVLVQAFFFEGSALAVLEPANTRVEPLPSSGEYDEPSADAVWLPDNRLLSVHRSGVQIAGQAPSINLWHIDPRSRTLIEPDGSQPVGKSGGLVPFGLTRFTDNRIGFGLAPSASEPSREPGGLFTAAPGDYAPAPFGALPEPVDTALYWQPVVWVPDGSGMLLFYENGARWFVGATGGPAVDLSPTLREATHVQWVRAP
jgi:hypothetical protein